MKAQQVQDPDMIIRNHAWFAFVPGFIPVPVFDVMGITAVQLDMIKQLCKFYDKPYDEQRGKAIVTSLMGSALGRIPGYTLRSAFKILPGIGWVLGGLSLSVSASATTYAVGQVFKEHFEEGGTLQSIDGEHLRQFYLKQLEEARRIVNEWLEKEREN